MTLLNIQTGETKENIINQNQRFTDFFEDVVINHFLIMNDQERDEVSNTYSTDNNFKIEIISFVKECPTLFLVTQTVRAMKKRITRLELQHELYFGNFERFKHYIVEVAGNIGKFFSDKENFGEFLHQWTRQAVGCLVHKLIYKVKTVNNYFNYQKCIISFYANF